MNIIYIYPLTTYNPNLFPLFKKTFAEHGIGETTDPREATHCFFDVHSGTISYDQNILNVVLEMGIPIICFDNREWGTMRNEKWYPIELNCTVYFVRNMNKEEQYPDNVFPFDWPYFPDCDFPPTSKEELFSRPYDCCFIGTEAPTRKDLINGILKDGRLKLLYEFRDHTKRIPYDQWINEYRQAKLFISCDGGGYTNERPNQLFSCAAMLKNVNNHLPANPLTDGINCLEINQNKIEEEIEKVIDILGDRYWLYDIYMGGISHTKKYLSQEYVSEYILNVLKKNTWIPKSQ